MKYPVFTVVCILLLCLAACAPAQSATLTPSPVAAITETAVSTPTPTLTAAPAPTDTAVSPTETPTVTPTLSAALSATPAPTATSTEPPTATVAFTETAVPPTAVSAAIPLTDLPSFAGQEVTVNGRVIATANFANGFKFTLDDGNGRAVLLLWHNVYDDTWDAPQLNVGAAVQATGMVEQYEGEWQIAPDFGGDVKVTTPGGTFAPARTIGELSNHVGELAQISGAILRLEATSSAVKIFVGDETGEIVVFVWRTVLDRIPNNVALGQVGTQVKVNGRVENYRSNLELVPALPYDVVVLP
jgi:DNA/RNA endonuclease YhcR with UshA esterase domain